MNKIKIRFLFFVILTSCKIQNLNRNTSSSEAEAIASITTVHVIQRVFEDSLFIIPSLLQYNNISEVRLRGITISYSKKGI